MALAAIEDVYRAPGSRASDSTSHRTSGASHQSAEGLAGGSLYRREASFSYIAERLAVLSDEHPAALGPDQGDETPRRELRHCRAFSSGGAEDVNGCVTTWVGLLGTASTEASSFAATATLF